MSELGRWSSVRLDWRDEAACAEHDGALWFPERGGFTAEAKRICTGCPVREECLEYAETNIIKFGVWGGLSERQRRMRRKGREVFCEGCGAQIGLSAHARWCEACRPGAKAEYQRRRRMQRVALEGRTA